MSDPPPDQSAASGSRNDPTTEQIKRVAAALESYAAHQEAADAKNAKHNRKVRRWARFATVGAVLSSLITVAVLIVSIISIQESRRAIHVANRAAGAAIQQASIMVDQTYRPHFRIRFISSPSNGPVVIQSGKTVSGIVDVLNNGQADAEVLESDLDIFWSTDGLPRDGHARPVEI
jgi:hypothetical protein